MHSFARCAFAPQNAMFFAYDPHDIAVRYARDPDADLRASWPEVLYVGNRLLLAERTTAGDPHRCLSLEIITPD
jgi:hypothetical protein